MTTLPAVVKPNAMPATARIHAKLAYLDHEGRPVKYDAASAIAPAADLRQAIVEIDGMNARVPDNEEALIMAKKLIGAYPNERAKDPMHYATAIASVFTTFPKDVGYRAIDDITLENEFPPTRAELHKACAKLVGKRNDMKRAAQAQLAEHDRRALAKPANGKLVRDMSDEERAEFFNQLRAKYPGGMPMVEAIAGQGDEPERGTAPVNRVED
jgi:hypothetical protein